MAFRLPYTGVTPHTWSLREQSGPMRLLSRHNEPGSGGAGAGGSVVFEFERLGKEPALLEFVLAAPWDDKPVQTRRVEIVSEQST